MEKSKSHRIAYRPPRIQPVLSPTSPPTYRTPCRAFRGHLFTSVTSSMHCTVSNIFVWNSFPTSCAWWTPTLSSSCSLSVICVASFLDLHWQSRVLSLSPSCAPWHVPATLSPSGSWVQVCLFHWRMSTPRLGSPSLVAKRQGCDTHNRCLINVG